MYKGVMLLLRFGRCLPFAISIFTSAVQADEWKTLEVTATAYNSSEAQTKEGNIGLAAWGDQLEPGMKAIAVSRDLIEMGLGYEAEVKIEGRDGIYIVRDKLNKRWSKRIDIYMGIDVEAAREWGEKEVTIKWRASEK